MNTLGVAGEAVNALLGNVAVVRPVRGSHSLRARAPRVALVVDLVANIVKLACWCFGLGGGLEAGRKKVRELQKCKS